MEAQNAGGGKCGFSPKKTLWIGNMRLLNVTLFENHQYHKRMSFTFNKFLN